MSAQRDNLAGVTHQRAIFTVQPSKTPVLQQVTGVRAKDRADLRAQFDFASKTGYV